MTQKIFRTMVLVMASGLGVSGVLSQAQSPNTSPTPQKMVPTPLQIAVQKAIQESKLNAPHTALQNAQNATQNRPVTPQNAQNTAPNTVKATANATPSAQPGQPAQSSAAPAENSAIAAMQSAKSALQKAGNKWGGHKVPAIRLINTALADCGQNQTANPAETNSSPGSISVEDERAAMESGMAELNNAKSDFEKVGNSWGACRPEALSLVDQALKELQAGVEFAKSHNN
jgi:hypothetical protein